MWFTIVKDYYDYLNKHLGVSYGFYYYVLTEKKDTLSIEDKEMLITKGVF